ncbi:MAG: DsrE family protein [Ignavibacteriae bacterium]|nr:DsrE family protein [Ignavibacteriota bacterium]
MKTLFILNEAPYGNEKSYNALRLAMNIQKECAECEVRMFLMADASGCAMAGQNTPTGYYNIERMLKSIIMKNGKVKVCGTCVEARGIKKEMLMEGAEISNMKELTEWTLYSDKVLTF